MHSKLWLTVAMGLLFISANDCWGYINGILSQHELDRLPSHERAIYKRGGWSALQGHRNSKYPAEIPSQKPPPDLPQLIEKLKNPDARIRHAAAFRIRETGETGKFAVPMLIQALRDPDSDVRWVAAGTLGELKSNAADALPALKRLSEDVNPQVRRAAADAVQQIEAAMKVSAVSSKP